jgi:SpoVK/Ycf46/Vps4 family AAA+-type ATPase
MVEAAGRALQSQMTFGVRALFTGPSGTGKTLSARILASMLGMELYRVDLSAIVNKYIGETEKNLNRVFTLSEEHDVVLLIDEGDALLTSRTAVQTSNDRDANLGELRGHLRHNDQRAGARGRGVHAAHGRDREFSHTR